MTVIALEHAKSMYQLKFFDLIPMYHNQEIVVINQSR